MRRVLSVLGTLLVLGVLTPVAAGHAAAPQTQPQIQPQTASPATDPARCGAWVGALSHADREAVARTKAAVDEVFEGRVTLPAKAPASGPIRLRVLVLATWKGTVAQQTTVMVTYRAGPCRAWTLAHPSHEEYLFFVDRTRAGELFAIGTEPRVVAHTTHLTSVLGPAVTTPSTPTPVTFTPAGASTLRPFIKVAAPGIALFLIGVLGLLVVGRLGRRPG